MTMRRITQHKSSEDKMKRRCDNVVQWSITNIRLFFKEISQDGLRNHGCNFRLDLFLYVTKLSKKSSPKEDCNSQVYLGRYHNFRTCQGNKKYLLIFLWSDRIIHYSRIIWNFYTEYYCCKEFQIFLFISNIIFL